MTHKNKKRLARRLREQEANTAVNHYKKQNYDQKALKSIHKMYMKTNIFLTQIWNDRKQNRLDRIHNREVLAQQRKATI